MPLSLAEIDKSKIFEHSRHSLLIKPRLQLLIQRRQYFKLQQFKHDLENLQTLLVDNSSQHLLRAAYRPIQKQLRVYTKDSSLYSQLFSFDSHKAQYPLIKHNIEDTLVHLEEDISQRKTLCLEANKDIQRLLVAKDLSDAPKLYQLFWRKIIEEIGKLLTHESQQELVYIHKLFVAQTILTLKKRTTALPIQLSKDKATDPQTDMIQTIEDILSDTLPIYIPHFKYLDKCLNKFYKIKESLIKKGETKNEKFGTLIELEKLILETTLSPLNKVKMVQSIMLSSKFLTAFKTESSLQELYARTPKWSPSLFNKQLPSVDEAHMTQELSISQNTPRSLTN